MQIEGLKTTVEFLPNEAMQYMELTCNRIPWDYNYEKDSLLRKKFSPLKTKISLFCVRLNKKKRDKAINSLTKGWGGALDTGYDTKDELQCIRYVRVSA